MKQTTFVESGTPICARLAGHGLDCRPGHIYLDPGRDFVYGDRGIGPGEFRITARLSLHRAPVHQQFIRMPREDEGHAAFCFSGGDIWRGGENELKVSGFVPPEVRRHSRFGFGHEGRIYVDGPLFGGLKLLDATKSFIAAERLFDFEVARTGSRVRFLLDGQVAYETIFDEELFGKVGFTAGQGVMHLRDFEAHGNTYDLDWQRSQPVGYTIPVADITDQPHRQCGQRKRDRQLSAPLHGPPGRREDDFVPLDLRARRCVRPDEAKRKRRPELATGANTGGLVRGGKLSNYSSS